jgi:iron(III) transport system substrate-binding protein
LDYLNLTSRRKGKTTKKAARNKRTIVIGQLETNLYCCSSDMIDDVISGTIYIAYNVLGSYASNHPLNDKYYIIYPADMTTVMSRSMILPVSSRNERAAKLFINHFLKRCTTQAYKTIYIVQTSTGLKKTQ